MRTFIVSASCLAAIVLIWLCFHLYSAAEIRYFEDTLDVLINESVDKDDWDTASASFDNLQKRWNSFRKPASFFLDSSALNHIDSTFRKIRYYIEAEDKSNSAGELAYLKGIFIALHKNETLTLENVF